VNASGLAPPRLRREGITFCGGDFYDAGDHQWMLRFEEKGGKSREIPARARPSPRPFCPSQNFKIFLPYPFQ